MFFYKEFHRNRQLAGFVFEDMSRPFMINFFEIFRHLISLRESNNRGTAFFACISWIKNQSFVDKTSTDRRVRF